MGFIFVRREERVRVCDLDVDARIVDIFEEEKVE